VSDKFPPWTFALSEVWVNTGSLGRAMQEVGISPSTYYRAQADVPGFADHMRQFEKAAIETLRLTAMHFALKGNEKLMAVAMAVAGDKVPESSLENLTNEQLAQRILSILVRAKQRAKIVEPDEPNTSTGATP
jgi:hypothetical protein